ncbi:MAG: substrate-binding domain-containing protein, partial [Boseongicola sp.]|nr:substrate-binding domain-containing protein [Boseongicola sp.]
MNLKELSSRLGLSQTTVSRALNGYPEVSESTRKRVQDAAVSFGYRPNTRARSLATGRSMNIGHVLPVSTRQEMVNPIFADFLAGASEAYGREGYNLLLSMVPDQDEEKTYRELAVSGTVDGVIVHSPKINDSRIHLLNSLSLPFVVHGRSSEVDVQYNWLDVNNRGAFRRATDFLIDLGHKRIALLNGKEHMDFAMRRRDGYLNALSDRGLKSDNELIRHSEMTERFGYETATELLARSDAPSAFLVASLIPAFGVRRAVEDAGMKVGRDISILVFDDDLSYFRDDTGVPEFTSVRSSVREAGLLAAELLLNVIETPNQPPQHRLL